MGSPNILFIITDQQRADSLGVVNGWTSTPNLDALARESAFFVDCLTTSPVCIPARFSLISGLYPHNLGVQSNQAVTFPSTLETWVSRLRSRGYRASMFGKNHLHPDGGDLTRSGPFLACLGFDDFDEVGGPRALQSSKTNLTELWDRQGLRTAYQNDVADRFANKPWVARPTPVGEELYYDTYVGKAAADYLRKYDRPEPWCCYVGFPGPHEPWDAPGRWATMYEAADMPRPVPAPISTARSRARGELDARLEQRPNLSEADIAALRANYAGEVSLIDQLIGGILDVVKQRGEWDSTVIVVTSDHGELNGDAGLLYKEVFLDGAVRVPLIIRDPMAHGPRQIAEPVQLIDVAATVLDLCGVLDGSTFRMSKSLGGVVRGSVGQSPDADAISEYDGEVMLATSEWKIALNRAGETYLLLDRRTGESDNLAGDGEYEHVQRYFETRLLRRLVESSSREPCFAPPAPPASAKKSILKRLESPIGRHRGTT